MPSKPSVSLIGLGRMGARHVTAAEQAGCQVVAAFDHSPAAFALTQNPALTDIVTADWDAFWSVPSDVLIIATTAMSHAALLAEGLRRGWRRFVVEKPFATGLGEARQVLLQAQSLGARVIVNHGRRYCPNHRVLAGLDGAPEMGALRSVSVTMGGGGFGCVGVHYLDVFDLLMGAAPHTVFAQATQPQAANPRGAQFDDPGGVAMLLYPGDRRAVLDLGDDVGVIGHFEALYRTGRVSFENEGQPWRIQRRKAEDRDRPLAHYGLPLEETILPGFQGFSIFDMAASAIADALSDGPAISGPLQALRSMEVFAAIRWSAASGVPVTLPLSADAEAATYAIP